MSCHVSIGSEIMRNFVFGQQSITFGSVVRLQEMTSNNQAIEDSKEQMGLKKLEATCDQVRINQDF